MPKTELVCVSMEPELKEEAEEVFSALGLSDNEAISLFYAQVVRHHDLPFGAKIPNAVSQAAIREAVSGVGLERVESVAGLLAPRNSGDY